MTIVLIHQAFVTFAALDSKEKHTQTHIDTYTHMHIETYMHTQTHTSRHTDIITCTYMCTH